MKQQKLSVAKKPITKTQVEFSKEVAAGAFICLIFGSMVTVALLKQAANHVYLAWPAGIVVLLAAVTIVWCLHIQWQYKGQQ